MFGEPRGVQLGAIDAVEKSLGKLDGIIPIDWENDYAIPAYGSTTDIRSIRDENDSVSGQNNCHWRTGIFITSCSDRVRG
ncbi:protein of unknown function [uncultured Woeseiaceae bacterium]|uniref:Uncharacterized protein n=1 Tax=uncultured Woeseiaceae bacterium TaxID=1983305 RepID=A0A7D9D271_9GAMM|nr:protein of unknown function [uncultured Woeseiaceae bacterium]